MKENTEYLFERLVHIAQSSLDSINDIEDLLDDRDDQTFSCRWMEEYNIVKSLMLQEKNKTMYIEFSDNLRENVFKEVLRRYSNSDLAAYISDDFGLLIDAVNLNYNSVWLNGLLVSYIRGEVPKGRIRVKEGTLSSLLLD
jgi:hypothetical protein